MFCWTRHIRLADNDFEQPVLVSVRDTLLNPRSNVCKLWVLGSIDIEDRFREIGLIAKGTEIFTLTEATEPLRVRIRSRIEAEFADRDPSEPLFHDEDFYEFEAWDGFIYFAEFQAKVEAFLESMSE